MRHVILGSDTTMGSSILRVLVSIGNQEIVCCNPDGIIPTDVPTTNITTFNVDIRNSQMLEAIIQEGDIVYNAQIYDDENVITHNFEELHVNGLTNLLDIGNRKKIRKIISYIPQKISWNIPIGATEETELFPKTKYQKSLSRTLGIVEQYLSKELFENTEILEIESEIEIEDNNEEIIELKEKSINEIEGNNEEIIDLGEETVDVIEDEENFENTTSGEIPESLTTKVQPPSLSTSPPSLASPPSLSVTPPTLGSSPNQTKDIDPISKKSDKNKSDQEEEGLEEENDNAMEEIQEEYNKYEVPLVIARVSRFYGPFDYTLTKKICQGVRLQRMSITGKLRREISWINPLDAGRAMIIMGDQKVKEGQYNISGFNATGSELIAALERVNYSKTKIKRRFFFIANFVIKIKNIFAKMGLVNRIEFNEIYGFNRTQVFSDLKAQTEWNWKPKYDMETTSKDSLNWYVNHVL
ncbi:MAG: hypothetical protein ACW99A_01365 [Candidatus Kariarchaeaceae archaeon]|jgi:nucleoside-diphosphate-sugar epimerase